MLKDPDIITVDDFHRYTEDDSCNVCMDIHAQLTFFFYKRIMSHILL